MTSTERTRHPVPEPGPGPDGGNALRVELAVARASAAARAGDLDVALRELAPDDEPALTRHRDVTHLRARVHAQRGELAAAERCWRQLLDEHPDDKPAAAGLARVRRFRRKGPLAAVGRARHRARPVVVIAVCAGAVAAAAWTLPGELSAGSGEPSAGAPAVDRVERDVRNDVAAQRQRTAAAAAARRARAVNALAKAARSPGARVVRHKETVEVVFDRGLFSQAAELTGTGSEQLARLGERLAKPRLTRIEVLGHIADVRGAPASGGSSTSVSRAMVAARALSDASGRPLTGFSIASAEQRNAPHTTDAGNRTVTVLLTPHTTS